MKAMKKVLFLFILSMFLLGTEVNASVTYYVHDGMATSEAKGVYQKTWVYGVPYMNDASTWCIVAGYLGKEKVAKVPGTINGKKVEMLSPYDTQTWSDNPAKRPVGILAPGNTKTETIVLPCTLKSISISGTLAFGNSAVKTVILPADLSEYALSKWCFGAGFNSEAGGNVYPQTFTVVCQKGSITEVALKNSMAEAAKGHALKIRSVDANSPEMLSTHKINANHVCEDCGCNFSAAHTHRGTLVKKQLATTFGPGLQGYYTCTCGKAFLDAMCTKEITDFEAWEKGEGAIPYPKTVKLSVSSYTYDGKVKSPSVIVKDNNGKTISPDKYTLQIPFGRKNVGTYPYMVVFYGDCYGVVTLDLNINPSKTTFRTLKAGKGSFTANWTKKTTQVKGYQIQYSLKSDFSSGNRIVTINSNKTATRTIQNLKAKTRYYVRIRTYYTKNGTKYYSGWSSKKYVTTK